MASSLKQTQDHLNYLIGPQIARFIITLHVSLEHLSSVAFGDPKGLNNDRKYAQYTITVKYGENMLVS